MKINLLRNSPDVMNGYFNIDPFCQGEPNKVPGDLANLDTFASDAECTEIVARDIIDYLDPAIVGRVIDHWVSKLRHGGKITIGGIDIYDVAKAVASYTLNPLDANALLHGGKNTWDARKSNYHVLQIAQELEKRGLRILTKRCNAYKYVVVAERP